MLNSHENITIAQKNARKTMDLTSDFAECRFSFIDDLAYSMFFSDGAEREIRELTEESFVSDFKALSAPLRAKKVSDEAPKQTKEFLFGLQKASETISLSFDHSGRRSFRSNEVGDSAETVRFTTPSAG